MSSTPTTACVRLVDTQITKGPNGFGLTLAEVLTFIPNKLLGLRTPSGISPDKVGFYQRLLQIRAVSTSSLPGSPNDRDTTQSVPNNSSVRAGDMLLAVEGFRLAGCTPEYAVRLLAGIPVGGVVHVTLLRGLALAPIQHIRPKPDEMPKPPPSPAKHDSPDLNKIKSSVLSHVNDRSSGRKSETFNPLIPKDSLLRSAKKVTGQTFTQSAVNTDGGKEIYDLEICKQPTGFGFTVVKRNDKFFVESVSSNLSYIERSGHAEKKLHPGDQLLEMGHLKLDPLTQSQVTRLFDSYPVGKSVRFAVSRAD
ncbi:unnamed protein product [Echinostoma caproni]|uniref:PDZ domain-containing protein n=1 Tax=Echinostoma caproni TaxID=27848 RepID=A0A183A508_9TREM|nr:unnamed protein product [Echinostoma caproni]